MNRKHLAAIAFCLLLCGCSSPPPPQPEPEGTGIGILSDEVLRKTARNTDISTENYKQTLAENSAAEPPFGSQQLPAGIKPYYAEMLTLNGQPFKYVSRKTDQLGASYSYLNGGGGTMLTVMRMRCAPDTCDLMMRGAVAGLTNAGVGEPQQISEQEIAVRKRMEGGSLAVRIFRLPQSVSIWTLAMRGLGEAPPEWLDRLTHLVARERAEEAAVLATQIGK